MAFRTTITNQQAFTLLEVLIAMLIFIFGILAVTTMDLTSTQVNSRAADMTAATALARQQMEILLNLNTNNPGLTDSNNDGLAGLGDATTDTADFNVTSGRYTILWNVARNQPINGATTVRVIVTWWNRNEDKTLSFTTIRL